VQKVKVLGVTIDRKLELLDSNWEIVIEKMTRLARYWTMFGLSISGRVLVAKTYIMSQTIYIMGVMPMSVQHGDRINEIILNFVKGNDRLLERRRQLLSASLGGYGLVDVNIMNVCVKSSWMDRWKRESDNPDIMSCILWKRNELVETWKVERNMVHDKGLLVLEDIVDKWMTFKRSFYVIGKNIWKGEVFDNEAIMEGRENLGRLIFNNDRYEEVKQNVTGVRLEDIGNENGILEKR
jgi:hypothetical protein